MRKPMKNLSTKPRKILWANRYCLLDTSSGASIHAKQMLLQLKRRNWDVRILGATIFDSERGMTHIKSHLVPKPENPYLKITDQDGLDHLLTVTDSWSADKMTNEEINKLVSIYIATLDEFQPDIVFFYGGNAVDWLIAEEARSRGMKNVALLVNPNYKGTPRWCRDVDLIVTDSQATADFYKESQGLDLLSLGTFIAPESIIADTHERKYVLATNPVLEKGGAVVALLAMEMAKRRPDITFEVVESRGLWKPVLEAVSGTRGQKISSLPNVVVTPNQPGLKAQYARARLVLQPSLWWESAGRVLVEAMFNGIPCIVTDRGGMPEIIENGGVKIQFDPEFYEPPYQKIPTPELLEPLINKIIELYDNEPIYESYVVRARSVALRKHNIETNTDKLVLELSKLCERGEKSSSNKPHKHPNAGPKSEPFVNERLWTEILKRFSVFAPNLPPSFGGLENLSQLTEQGAVGTLLALDALLRKVGNQPASAIISIADLELDPDQLKTSVDLTERFNHYGSDKAISHGYEKLYALVLSQLSKTKASAILEIGLGLEFNPKTKELNPTKKPSASARALRDVCSKSWVYVASTKGRELENEDRIKSFYVDQTRGNTFADLKNAVGLPFDLIIDDGLHAPHTNLNTLLFALEGLRPGGYFMIEDIVEQHLPTWKIVQVGLSLSGVEMAIYKGKLAYMIVVKKPEISNEGV